MKVLITGGSGFVGSHLADRLLARGDTVTVIDNYSTGRRDNLKPQRGLKIVEGCISDAKLIKQLSEDLQPDIVVHAAAAYKDPQNWEEDARTNVLGTTTLLKASVQAKVKRFIYFQTALCYGLKPIEQPITLQHPILPSGSSYAISKTAGEQYVEHSGLDFVTFRLANAYGPRNISGPLPVFFQRIIANKPCFVTETRRDFIYIDDLIDCVVSAVDGKGRGTYHIASGKDYAIQELFDKTVKCLGVNVQAEVRSRQPDDVFSILLDPSKTKQDFGWDIKTLLEDGIRSTINYYKTFGIEETFTHLKAS